MPSSFFIFSFLFGGPRCIPPASGIVDVTLKGRDRWMHRGRVQGLFWAVTRGAVFEASDDSDLNQRADESVGNG